MKLGIHAVRVAADMCLLIQHIQDATQRDEHLQEVTKNIIVDSHTQKNELSKEIRSIMVIQR